MKKSPFAKLLEDIDNDMMQLFGAHIHKRVYEEHELRDILNKAIGNVEEGYDKELIKGHEFQSVILSLINNASKVYPEGKVFETDKVFNEDSLLYKKYLKDVVDSFDKDKKDKWNDFKKNYLKNKTLDLPKEFKEFLFGLCEFIPYSKTSKLNDRDLFKDIINDVISDDKKEALSFLNILKSKGSKNIKEIFYEEFEKRINDNPILKESYAKELDRAIKSSDGKNRSIVQISNKEKKDHSYFAIYHLSANEKKLTIEETIRKMNDISKGAISRFKDYRFKDTNGDIRTIDDIIGMKKAASNFDEKLKEATLNASITPIKKKLDVDISKENKTHKKWVIDTLDEYKQRAIDKNTSKSAKDYVSKLYDSMIEAANTLPLITLDNVVFADMKDMSVMGNIHDFISDLTSEELDTVLGNFDKVPDVFINDEVKTLKEDIIALKLKDKEKEQEQQI